MRPSFTIISTLWVDIINIFWQFFSLRADPVSRCYSNYFYFSSLEGLVQYLLVEVDALLVAKSTLNLSYLIVALFKRKRCTKSKISDFSGSIRKKMSEREDKLVVCIEEVIYFDRKSPPLLALRGHHSEDRSQALGVKFRL